MTTASALPLDGIRVLELGHIVAGPSAGLVLADLGADVIKVERAGEGDQSRTMPAGTDALFHFLNRNKRSIAIDLKGSAEGRALFLRLAAVSDVVIDNFAHGAVEALGLGYDVLARANPGLIYLGLKGFLPGPNETRPFLDELAQMSAGLAFMTGPRGQPMRAGASIVDVGAAAYGVIAVLAALQQRAKTGLGQRITSGLYETTVFWVGQWLAQYAATGEPGGAPAKTGNSVADINAGILAVVGICAAYAHKLRTGQGQVVDTSLMEAALQQTYWQAAIYFATGRSPQALGSAHAALRGFRRHPL